MMPPVPSRLLRDTTRLLAIFAIRLRLALASLALLAVAAPALAAAPADVQRQLQEASEAMDSARTLIARGEARSAKKRLDEASRIYREVLRDNSEQRDAAVGLAGVLFLEKKYEEGANLLRPFHERLPDDPDISHQLGLHLYRSGEQALAVPLLEAVANDPRRFDAMWLLIQHYYRQANWQAGLTHAEHYLVARPDDTEALALIGTYFLKAEQFDRAVATLDKYLESHAGNISARINRANALYRKGEVDKAGQEYERLLEEQPDKSRFIYNLASVRIKQDRCPEALLLLDRFLGKEAKNGPALYFRADCLLKLGRYEEARTAFERAGVEGQNSNPWVWYGLSRVALRKKSFDEAIENAKRAQDLGPNEPELAAWLGTVYRKAKRPAEGLGWHDKAVSLKGDEASYHIERGFDLWVLGRTLEALGAFEKGRGLDPTNSEASRGIAAARTALGIEAWQKGQGDEAEGHFREAIAAYPGYHAARANLVVVRASLGRLPDAEKALAEAPADAASNPDVQAATALVRLLTGKTDQALSLASAARANKTSLLQVVAQVEGQAAAAKGDWDVAAKSFDEAHTLAPTPALDHAKSQAWLELGLERLGRGDAGGARDALGRANRGSAQLETEDKQTLEFALQTLGVLGANEPGDAAKVLANALASQRFAGANWARVRDVGQGYVAYGWLRAGNAEEARKALERVRDRTALGAAWESLSSAADDVEARKAFGAGNFAAAEKVWAAMVQRGNKDTAVQNNLAAARFMLGRGAEAEALWRPLADAGAPAEAIYNLGNALGRRGEHKAAWELFQRYGKGAGSQADRVKERAEVKARLFGFGGGN